jgi:hypothetical protein
MKRVIILLLTVLLVVACFSGCGEKLARDKKYDIDKIGETEIWHNLGDLKDLRAGEYPVLVARYFDNAEVYQLYPTSLVVSEIYGDPKNIVTGDEVYLMLQLAGITEEPMFIKIN